MAEGKASQQANNHLNSLHSLHAYQRADCTLLWLYLLAIEKSIISKHYGSIDSVFTGVSKVKGGETNTETKINIIALEFFFTPPLLDSLVPIQIAQ